MEKDNTCLGNIKTLLKPILVTQIKDKSSRIHFLGYATGISKEGLFIPTTRPKKEKMKCHIQFCLKGSEESIKCLTEVVWATPYIPHSHKEAGMGLKFLDLNEKQADKIDCWIKEH